MSGYEVGDVVRVTVEGEVKPESKAWPGELLVGPRGEPNGWYVTISRAGRVVAEVEKLAPPLPTTPGSVARVAVTGDLAFLKNDGNWVDVHGSTRKHWPSNPAWEVLFDAGAV